jgi:hypothetical protein
MMSQQVRQRQGRWHGFPLAGLVLVALGVLFLLQTTGVVPWNLWGVLWRFWPVLVIAFGINIILGRRVPWLAAILILVLLAGTLFMASFFTISTEQVSVPAEFASGQQELDGLESVDVNIEFGAGELVLSSLPEGSPLLMDGSFYRVGAETSLVRSGSSGELDVRMRDRELPFVFGENADWEISLSQTPRINLNLDSGASSVELDLRDLLVTDLTIDTGASSLEVRMPAHAGHVNARITGGASSIEVIIPDGVAARIKTDSGLSSVDIDSRRFPNVNGTHVSPDFDTAENRIDLGIDSGVSSITVF